MNYTHKQALTDTINGRAAQYLPFAPRLDIWYRANKLRGTLPPEYKNHGLLDIIDDLDVGYNTMIPDYLDMAEQDDYINRGTGFYFSNTSNCYKIKFHNVGISHQETGGNLRVKYKTPFGELETHTIHDDEMKCQGITICSKKDFLIKSNADFPAAEFLLENAEVIPQYSRLEAFAQRVGNRGITTAIGLMRESPARLLQMELMSYEQMTYDLLDYPEEMQRLMGVIGIFLDKCMAVAAGSCAQVITAGAHFDKMLSPPPFFREYMLPWLQKHQQILHRYGKLMACHTDSDNEGLLPIYLESGMDIADSVCTKPLTGQSYEDIRGVLKQSITLYGLIPSIATLPDSMGEYEFERFLDELLTKIQQDGARRIILAIADTTPPGADINRIRKIAKLSRQIKPR